MMLVNLAKAVSRRLCATRFSGLSLCPLRMVYWLLTLWTCRTIAKYLDQPSIRALLGVDPSVTKNMSACDPGVSSAFAKAHDSLHISEDYVGGLLERGVRVLIYVGVLDWICNWVGNE